MIEYLVCGLILFLLMANRYFLKWQREVPKTENFSVEFVLLGLLPLIYVHEEMRARGLSRGIAIIFDIIIYAIIAPWVMLNCAIGIGIVIYNEIKETLWRHE